MEKAYTVRYLMPRSMHQSRTSRSLDLPISCPLLVSSVPSTSFAYLLFPSMMTAICWGISYALTSFSMRDWYTEYIGSEIMRG